jgi:hypothetical protein
VDHTVEHDDDVLHVLGIREVQSGAEGTKQDQGSVRYLAGLRHLHVNP